MVRYGSAEQDQAVAPHLDALRRFAITPISLLPETWAGGGGEASPWRLVDSAEEDLTKLCFPPGMR